MVVGVASRRDSGTPQTTSGLGRRRVIVRAAAYAVAAALVLVPTVAGSQSLGAARTAGTVGERFDGFVEARSSSAAIRKMVADVNSQRAALYKQRAREQNVPAAQVGQVYATKIYNKLPPGAWFRDSSGKWKRK